MIILGIDPGTLVAGYGVVEIGAKGGRRDGVKLIEYGEVVMSGKTSLAVRLRALHEKISAVIDRTQPDACAIESAFSHKNIRSAMIIGHARGVALLAAAQHNLAITEYSPREVKRAITGNGAATKEQVQFMVCNVLKLTAPPKTFDASDALAVALCHQQHFKFTGASSKNGATKSWKDFIAQHPERVAKNN